MTNQSVSLSALRRLLPDWTWTAHRDGFGWAYRGLRDGRKINVRPYSVLSGWEDGEFRTQWRAETEVGSVEFFWWAMSVVDSPPPSGITKP